MQEQAHTADFYCAVLIFGKLPISRFSDTLHADLKMSLAKTGGTSEVWVIFIIHNIEAVLVYYSGAVKNASHKTQIFQIL